MKWRSAVQLGRVSNLPTVWSNVLAGLALSGSEVRPLFLAGLAAALSCFYVGGMFLNDGFDREVDTRERPERPLPSGRATPREVFTIGFGLLVAGLLFLAAMAWLGPVRHAVRPTLLAGLGLGALIVAYDLHHKNNPLGPFVMALCRGAVYVTAALAVGSLSVTVLKGAAVLVAYLVGLSLLAREEGRAGATVPWALALLCVPLVVVGRGVVAGRALDVSWAAPLATLLFLIWIARALSFLTPWRGGQVGRTIGALIAGISLLDAAQIAGHAGFGWVMAAWAAGALTLFGQRYVRGT